MSVHELDYRSRVLYIRDAKSLANNDREELSLDVAVQRAIANHRAGESPVIIGNSIQLIGIESILAVRNLNAYPANVNGPPAQRSELHGLPPRSRT